MSKNCLIDAFIEIVNKNLANDIDGDEMFAILRKHTMAGADEYKRKAQSKQEAPNNISNKNEQQEEHISFGRLIAALHDYNQNPAVRELKRFVGLVSNKDALSADMIISQDPDDAMTNVQKKKKVYYEVKSLVSKEAQRISADYKTANELLLQRNKRFIDALNSWQHELETQYKYAEAYYGLVSTLYAYNNLYHTKYVVCPDDNGSFDPWEN